MNAKIPVFDNCSISESGQENFLAMDLEQYIHKHADMVFPHRHSFYHLVLFVEGKGSFTIDFTNFTIKPYMAYFMSPGQVHSWEFEGVPKGFVINFAHDFFHSLLLNPEYIGQFGFFSGSADDNVVVVPGPKRERAEFLLKELLQEVPGPDFADHNLLRIILLHFFHLLEDRKTGPQEAKPSATGRVTLEQFKTLLELHFKKEKFPSFYADKLRISSNHLNNLCKAHLGKQAGELIRERVVLEAKRSLIIPGNSITSLSYDLNFSDNSNFTKFFKKHVGMNPEQFRKKYASSHASHQE